VTVLTVISIRSCRGRGNVTFPHRDVDRVSAAGGGPGSLARPMKVPADKLKTVLGVRRIDYVPAKGFTVDDATLA